MSAPFMTSTAVGNGEAEQVRRRGAQPVALSRSHQRLTPASAKQAPDRLTGWLPRAGAGDPRDQVRRPLSWPAVLAVTGVGGGAGRTTMTAAVGGTLAAARRHPVVAVDAAAGPAGTLAWRVRRTTSATVREFLRDPTPPDGHSADRYVNVDASGLRVLAGTRPGHGHGPVLTDAVLPDVVLRLARWYRLLLLDLPTVPAVPTGSVWPWVRRRAAAVVFVVRPNAAELLLLAETLAALQEAGMAAARQRAVVVVNQTVPRPAVRAARAAEQLVAARVRSVVWVPFDSGLYGGQQIRLDRLRRRTRRALLQVAADCAAQFE